MTLEEVFDALQDYAESSPDSIAAGDATIIQALSALAIASALNNLARVVAEKEVLTVVNE